MDYLNKLIADEIFFDSLGVLKLRLAEGYELDGDLVQAENYYSEVADQSKNNSHVAEASYRLGLIYQFDYDNLTRAKEYYDKASKASRSTFAGQDSFQRSTDIGKLDEYKQKVQMDTGATLIKIDEAAARQYELAELYWFNLNKPDSAINEMRYLIDNFPASYDAPKAMIALSAMVRNFEGDTLKADSILNQALANYPNSDYMPEIMEELKLRGTPVDSGYPEYYFRKAENYLIDREMKDSAKYYYQIVVDSFPDSKYYLHARFALIWVAEFYESPGDSSVYFAYQEFADSFAGTDWALLAKKKLAAAALQNSPTKKRKEEADTAELTGEVDKIGPSEESLKPKTDAEDTASASGYSERLESIYIGESGDKLPLFTARPVQTRELFVYPTEAYYLEWEGDLYFQIKLDFSGEVLDHRMMTHSASPELDNRADISVKSMRFDQLDVSKIVADLSLEPAAEGGGYWFVYKYKVILPDHLR
jgi:tetratricopeptide (TPR) repeat protein